ncbi:AraC family transcriptional regulator [Ruegeria sp. HKCCA4008]|uniref:helix-turn-helix transcriptional regulator n=1 Tax=Ruegeria sp. HKCCA4008 TaxID=2682999 RepID=UPI00148767ED|nr:AraC family transcriptional regulator [Ruegeria sp. HKCCA4008]
MTDAPAQITAGVLVALETSPRALIGHRPQEAVVGPWWRGLEFLLTLDSLPFEFATLPVKCQALGMDRIKNSPNSQKGVPSVSGGVTPAAVLKFEHPNKIGEITPWEIDFRQLDPGRLSTSIRVRSGRSVSALSIAMNQRVHQRGVSPKDWMTFGIPSNGAVDKWQAKDVTDNAFLSFGDSDGFDGVSTAGFSGNVISFQTRRLENFAESCGFHLARDTPDAHRLRSKAGLASMAKLEGRVAGLLNNGDAQWSEAAEQALMLEALIILTDNEAHFDRSQAGTRRRALERATDLMVANLEDPISIEEICKESGASWRTLDRAFKEQFGQSPKSYYMRLRLNRVREDLLSGSFSGRITDAANRLGFWHMGQFARDYRLFFRELPSETRGVQK